VSRSNVRAEAQRATGGGLRHVYTTAIQGFAFNGSAQAVEALKRRNPRIGYCEQDQEVTLGQVADPLEFRTLARPGSGTTSEKASAWDIDMIGGGSGSSAAVAWVIDSGIDLDHPDLNVDKVRSRNFVLRDSSADDLNGHGTHVAGTIGAIRGNGKGAYGVVPGASVVAVRVLDRRGSGAYSDVIAGVNYVGEVAKAGDVVNMSIGGPTSDALDTAVLNVSRDKQLFFALAAGNESEDYALHSPARAGGVDANDRVYSVGSFTQSKTWSGFSNYGAGVAYAEPGSSIYSTYKDGSYATLSGTSMASPHLAGLLLLGAPNPGGTVQGPDRAYTIGVR
jgi:subtilisin family serine protease